MSKDKQSEYKSTNTQNCENFHIFTGSINSVVWRFFQTVGYKCEFNNAYIKCSKRSSEQFDCYAKTLKYRSWKMTFIANQQ